jgi:hypothetical protein
VTGAGPVGCTKAHYAGSRRMRTAIGPGGAGPPGDGGGLGTVEADAPPAADTGDGGGLGTVQAGAPPGALTPATAATLDAIAVWQIGLTDYPI